MSAMGPAMVRAIATATVRAMVPKMVGLILALGCTALASAADQPSGAADCRGIADANARLACFDRGACRDIADAAARLACFDRAAVPAPASPAASAAPTPRAAPPVIAAMPAPAPAATPAPAAVTARVAPAPVTPPAPAAAATPVAPMAPEQRFGLPEHKVVQKEVEAGARDKDASKIQAQIVRLEPAADQRMVFTLDNAQVWRQLSAEGDLLAKPGDTVTISRGLFGSYWLQAPTGRGSKVSRLR